MAVSPEGVVRPVHTDTEKTLVLGLESSCDETAAAVIENGCRVVSSVISSQVEIHAPFGGVVPELASRAHVTNIIPVVTQALQDAQRTLDAVDAIAVTHGPGLVGALLVALQSAKAMAFVTGKPLVGVHHLEGHLTAVYLEESSPPFPHLGLVVSGGHTSLVYVYNYGEYRQLGATRDDAAGEAFDKVAKLLGLGYPGGVAIDRLAKTGDPTAVPLPRAMTAKKTKDDFSFSGLKTAVLNHVRASGVPQGAALADLCASFQATVVEVLVRKTRRAALREGLRHVQLCGGVAANSLLRTELARAGSEDGFKVYVPHPRHCTDNAAMIAAAGYYRLRRGVVSSSELTADSSLPLPGRRAD